MITLAQPSLVLNSFGVKSHYAFSMWRTWNMPQGATSKDVVYWIATACDQAPELALHHVVLHAHADDGIIYVGQDPAGNDNSINPWNVADFQALASKDIGCIWLHACSPAATSYGARFCLQLAANSGTTVVAAADVQTDWNAAWATVFMPAGNIDDFEGRVYQFSADGSNYWLINPNGGTFDGPPTIYSTQG
jgi:Domain of unknown function (DUF4347)